MRTTSSLRLLLLGLLTVGFAGCLDVEAEVPEIEVTQRNLAFEGTPISRLVGETSTMMSYPINRDSLPFDKDLLEEVEAYEVKLEAAGNNAQTLDFIRNLRMSIRGKNGAGAAEIASYERDEKAPIGRKLVLKRAVPVEVTKALDAGGTELVIEVAGMLPDKAWAVDVSLKLQAKGKLKYKIGKKK